MGKKTVQILDSECLKGQMSTKIGRSTIKSLEGVREGRRGV